MTIALTEDPFGPGDPLELARLVRRVLAAAGRKAVDVSALVVVTDVDPGMAALVRFTRRALGPHGETIRPTVELVAADAGHGDRVAMACTHREDGPTVVLAVVLGPADVATACSLLRSTRWHRV